MAYPLGKTVSVYLNGYNFSGHLNGYDSELAIGKEDITTFGPSFHKRQAPTLVESKITLKGFYSHSVSPDVSGYLNQLIAGVRTETPGMEVDPGSGTTPAAGDLADLWITTGITRKQAVEAGAYVKLDAELLAKHGMHVGEAICAETAFSGSPFTSTGYDQGGSGWVSATYRYLVIVQVLAYTSGLAALKVQTSPDNSTWTTRGTFPAITGIGGYALELNTTLGRYLRLTDTGVATIIAAWAIMH